MPIASNTRLLLDALILLMHVPKSCKTVAIPELYGMVTLRVPKEEEEEEEFDAYGRAKRGLEQLIVCPIVTTAL